MSSMRSITKELCAGVFWVVTENSDLSGYKLLLFEIPCDAEGNIVGDTTQLNAKSGITYNHQKLWNSEIKNSAEHRPYNKREFDYYPRGRIQIANNKATIFLNPHIDKPRIVNEIKLKCGLIRTNIGSIKVYPDHSPHYQCFIDRE